MFLTRSIKIFTSRVNDGRFQVFENFLKNWKSWFNQMMFGNPKFVKSSIGNPAPKSLLNIIHLNALFLFFITPNISSILGEKYLFFLVTLRIKEFDTLCYVGYQKMLKPNSKYVDVNHLAKIVPHNCFKNYHFGWVIKNQLNVLQSFRLVNILKNLCKLWQTQESWRKSFKTASKKYENYVKTFIVNLF